MTDTKHLEQSTVSQPESEIENNASNLKLSNSDLRRLQYFEVAAEISRSTSTEELKRACNLAAAAFSYDYYLFGGYYPVVETIVMSSTFPDEWRERYDSKGYISVDPTVKHCWTSTNPIDWQKIEYSEGKTGEMELAVMEEAAEYGLRFGISIPVHGSGAEGCMLSFVSKEPHVDHNYHDEAGLQIIVHAMHEATKLIIAKTELAASPTTESLTPREIECLSWTAKGKTSWATSRILDVSENTVIFHLRNAIKKLEVTNRSHAVAKAVAHSKITPF